MTTGTTYAPGQLVERISTGERALFVSTQTMGVLRVEITDTTGYNARAFWTTDDCHPVDDHPEQSEELEMLRGILAHIEEGHTIHCAKRMAYGDGECECDMVGNGRDTIAVVALKEELAAKDAEIARLNAEINTCGETHVEMVHEASLLRKKIDELTATINGLSDDLITPYLLSVEHGKDAMRGEVAKMRKLCGMNLPWPLHDTVAKLVEATKAFLHKHNSDIQGWEEWHCAAQYGDEYAKQLRAAAEGE